MISLIHPSRGRFEKSFMNHKEWVDKAGVEVETIVSVDLSDPQCQKYIDIYGSMCYATNNQSLVEATNYAAIKATGDILVYLSDDFACFPNWGKVLINEFEKYQGPTLLKVDDCLQKFDVPVLTIPIMNRACYENLGYFFHPDFKSMHCDEHLYWRAKKLGFLKSAPHIKFEHRHVSVGKAQDDDTYRRSAANWDHGVRTFAKHKIEGFVR
jgi:hypothetical protein